MLKSSNKLAKTAKYLDKAYDTSKALKRIKNSRKALETPAEVNKRKRQLAKVATENKVKELTKGLEKLTSSKGRKFTQEAAEQLNKSLTSHQIGNLGEKALAKSVGGSSHKVFNTSLGKRVVDQFADGIAHESKVGFVNSSAFVRKQIAKDANLIANNDIVQGAMWHFYKSPKTGLQGASETVIKLLNDNNIPYVFEEF